MSNGINQADEVSAQAMVAQYDETRQTYRGSLNQAQAIASDLKSAWASDTAAGKFNAAIDDWASDLQVTAQYLEGLNEAMQQYRTLTAGAESDNASVAGGWATSHR